MQANPTGFAISLFLSTVAICFAVLGHPAVTYVALIILFLQLMITIIRSL